MKSLTQKHIHSFTTIETVALSRINGGAGIPFAQAKERECGRGGAFETVFSYPAYQGGNGREIFQERCPGYTWHGTNAPWNP